MKLFIVLLPVFSIFLTAMASGDKFLSFAFNIKMTLALLFIIIAIVLLVISQRRKLNK